MSDQRLAAVRLSSGWRSRAAYARACGLSGPTCWRIETQVAHVRDTTLNRYGHLLGLSAEQVAELRPRRIPRPSDDEMRPLYLPAELWRRIDAAAKEVGLGYETMLRIIARQQLETHGQAAAS